MVFKLVRTDSVETSKIQLPAGRHMIGRGKFLNCDDKRVSRNHGELEVTQDTVTVKAMHLNPCFILKKGTDETQLLKQNHTQDIGNGDRIGLLPDSYWYELLHCTIADDNQPQDLAIAETKSDADSAETEPFDAYQENLKLNESDINDSFNSPSLLCAQEDRNTASADEEGSPHSPNKRSFESDNNDSCSVLKKPKIELIVKEESSTSAQPVVMQASSDEQDLTNDNQELNDGQDLTNSVKQELNDENDLKNSAAGPSNDQAGTSATNDNSKAASPVNPPLKRERCMYGVNCYRRNPQHKVQFSHPSDADWGAGARGECPWGAACRRRDARGECPWGAACRRRDARHWRDHDHPPGVRPAASHHPGKGRKPTKRISRSDNDEDDDDDDDDEDTPPLILHKKRTRKTRQVNCNESDSNEEDPYGTDDDGDSEWQPSEGWLTNSEN